MREGVGRERMKILIFMFAGPHRTIPKQNEKISCEKKLDITCADSIFFFIKLNCTMELIIMVIDSIKIIEPETTKT